ncbi:hypothetical protein MSIMFI_00072 [Mycobacterium simulans]|nr:hypothetical protein MSIMFI_00072 [Mycobacterium simulans]
MTDPNEDAAAFNSLATPFHAAAAANIGSDPGPVRIRTELISGGNTKKLIRLVRSALPRHRRPSAPR